MPETGVQIKICGLTHADEAAMCAALGIDAIGCVFFPKSPRHLTDEQARRICLSLPAEIARVGVFVNEPFASVMHKIAHCGLSAVQLHGRESPEFVTALRKESVTVIKALFDGGEPSLEDAHKYDASAFLLECAKGKLPGGNAMVWNWEKAKGFRDKRPFVLAGGLSPENVTDAIRVCSPYAVDVSSGVEASPGRKDIAKAEAFVKAVSSCPIERGMEMMPIFGQTL